MSLRNHSKSFQGWVFALVSLAGATAYSTAALAQEAGGTVVVVPQVDMWECANRQNLFDYPAGVVTAVTLNANTLTIDLAGASGDAYSFAVVARVDYDGGSEKASYQIHNNVQSTGYLDPTTGFPIPGTESQVVISGTLETAAQVTAQLSPGISAGLDDLIQTSGGVITGTLISGQMPPIQPGDPNVYVQVNTFYLPTENGARACGEYLIYFSSAGDVSLGRADGIHDGLLCNSGVRPYAVPAGMDLTNAQVIYDSQGNLYTFTLEFGRVIELTEPFAGGVELYDPGAGLPAPDPGWLFNNTGNWSFNFALPPDGELQTFASHVVDGVWEPIAGAEMTVSVEGNRIVMEIGGDAFLDTVETWFATVTNFSVCDEIGLGNDNLPFLPVPQAAAEPTATPTSTPPPPPTATPTLPPEFFVTQTAIAAAAQAEATDVLDQPEGEDEPVEQPRRSPMCGQLPLILGFAGLIGLKMRRRAVRMS